jgi:excisionase family DNA binding protein
VSGLDELSKTHWIFGWIMTADDSRGGELNETLPRFLTAGETADLLRTTPKAVYSMIERGQMPGVKRLGRRVLIQTSELLDFLDHACTPSSEGRR